MEASFEYSNTLSSVLHFRISDDAINKKERRGPKGYLVKRFVGSAEIVDLEGDIIDLQALAKVMPIMLKQGGRIQSFHSNHPGGEFFDWGFTKYKSADAIWVDVEIYDEFPSQQDNLRRILLPEGHKERINGLSLGGFKLAKKRECDAIRCWTRIMDLEGWEYSFVDDMANPLAENIENQIENMEFDSLNKEQSRDYDSNHDIRDSKGRFASEPQISSIETITKTSYGNTEAIAAIDTCPCGKHIDKGEYENDKKKPKEGAKPEEESSEEVDVDVEIEAKEGEAGEEAEPMEGEPPMESEEQTEREGIAVANSKLDTLLAALNVENIYKGKEKEMDEPQHVEFEGKKYIRKGDNLELVKEEAPVEPETPETTETKTEVPDLEAKLEKKFEEKFKAFTEEFMKAAKSETEVSSETENPAQQEIKEEDQEQLFFKKGSSIEERFAQAYPRTN